MSRSLLEIESFGGTAAEDDDLKRFFVRTPAFEALWGGTRNVVVGRKGSGKTALYLALADRARAEGRLARALSFAEYPWQAHYRYASTEVSQTERFVNTWRFLILVEALSALVERPPAEATRQQSRALGEVRKFLEDNYGSTRFDFKKAFPSKGLKFSGLELGPSAGGVSVGSASFSKDEAAGVGLGESLARVNQWLMAKVEILGSVSGPIYVLFDELDLGYDPTDENYKDRVIGLLLAARRLGGLGARGEMDIRPVVFLRSDIFDRLKFGDKNKIRSANTEELQWHDKLDHEGASLKHLIDWRIKEVLGVDDVERAWDRAFDPKLTRGTQHKFQHMSFRTFLRPRDIITFVNISLKKFQEREKLRGGDPSSRIDNEDISASRDEYSDYFRLELDDEIGEAEEEWESLLEVLKAIGSAKFSNAEFEAAYQKVARRMDLGWGQGEVLPFLYHYSIIGFERTRASGSGLTFHFKYLGESVRFDPDANQFLVHRGLKEALNLRETL